MYVAASSTGANDGSGWADAYIDLQSALDAAEQSGGAITQIWVSAGTYKPSKRTDPKDPRSATFNLIDGVSLYGGFAGFESSIDERNIEANPTILSGDFNGDDEPEFVNYEENASHVVTVADMEESIVCDGFTVSGGYAWGATYGSDRGGGMYISNTTPLIRNCTFARNFAGRDRMSVAHAYGGGAGAYVVLLPAQDPPRIVRFVNCKFQGNVTVGIGGGVFLFAAYADLTDCVFDGNRAMTGGGLGTEKGYGFELHSSTFGNNNAAWDGGAVSGTYNVAAMIDKCVFGNNTAGSGGGAVFLAETLTSVIVGSAFEQNAAESGGAVLSYGSTSVSETFFHNNTAISDGAAIAVQAGTLAANGCTFFNNSANRFGGALFVRGDSELRASFLSGNTAANGGGIFTAGGHVRVSESLIEANSAFIGAGISNQQATVRLHRSTLRYNLGDVGAALAHNGSEADTEVVSCLIVDNHASLYGGGFAAGAGPLSIINCTISENTADALGGGLIASADTSLLNSIVWANRIDPTGEARHDEVAQIEGIEFATINYSLIQGWSGVFGGEGNLGLDPWFVVDDFHLEPGSPCINTGLTETIDWVPWDLPPPALDLDGKPRVLCGRVDLGAYEFGLLGDVDCNFVLDLDDFAAWAGCATGPSTADTAVAHLDSVCTPFDADGDGDNDLRDLAKVFTNFQMP